MGQKLKLLIGVGIIGVLMFALGAGVAGFWMASNAFAQGAPSEPSIVQGSCHDNQAVFQLLGLSREQVLAHRQAGKSLLDIAKAQGVDETRLTNALVQPLSAMHGNQANAGQMTQQMQQLFSQDLREPKFGTMTDYHLGLEGTNGGRMNGTGGMMNGANPMMGNRKY